jgi:protein-histidine N-methyltransferase
MALSNSVACDQIVRWVVENGGSVAPIGLHKNKDSERGVHALRSIQSGQVVAEIPRRCMVTLDTVRNYDCGRSVMDGWPDASSKQIYLAVFLLEQRLKANSWWSPYLDSIPKQHDNFPLFYNERDLQLLAGSSIPLAVAKRRAAYAKEFSRVMELAPALSCFSLADYMWARAAVMSRLFRVTIQGQETQALVPFADLLNHSRQPETEWAFDDGDSAFLLRCTARITKGAEVHDCYGRKSNTRFLQNYGFTVPDNLDDEATVWIKAPDWGSDAERRSLEFGTADDGLRRFRLGRSAADGDDAISFLRLVFARGRELRIALESSAGQIPVLSKRNERAAMTALARVCRKALARYRSTVEEDDKLLACPSLELNERNCITTRRGEKMVLRIWVSIATKGLRSYG